MVVNLNDNSQAWEMNSNGSYERIKNIKNLVSAHNYFMSNPSLSGRGESIKKNRPEEITLKK